MKKITFFTILIVTVTRCGSIDPQSAESGLLLLDTAASCPFITQDNKNNQIISYIKHLNDSVSVLRFRIGENDGRWFSEFREVKGSENIHPHGENLPKVAFKNDGTIIAAWGAQNNDPRNKYAGLIYFSQSFDGGANWETPRRLVKDTGSYDQRYFDLAALPDGEVAMIWLDSRETKDQEGSSIYFAKTEGKKGFVNERIIDESICPCCRTELFIDSFKTIHAVYRGIINDSIRDMVHMVSTDNGRTFSNPRRISADNWVIRGCPHTGPSMTQNNRGLHFSWYTGEGPAGVYFCSSDDKGTKFTMKDSVSKKNSAKHPQLTTLNDNQLVIAWDETIQYGEHYNSRIGLQLRNEGGKSLRTYYLTPDSLVCEFPVLGETHGRLVVAFTQKKENQQAVFYRLIRP